MVARDALMRLVSDTFATRLIDKGRRASEFEELGRLVGSVPLRMVNAGAEISGLSELCRAIVEDFRAGHRSGNRKQAAHV